MNYKVYPRYHELSFCKCHDLRGCSTSAHCRENLYSTQLNSLPWHVGENLLLVYDGLTPWILSRPLQLSGGAGLILGPTVGVTVGLIKIQSNSIRKLMAVCWNWNGSGGTRLESEKNQGVCFHVSCTIAPKCFYVSPFLGSKVNLVKGRPWMTFLSRSNEGGQKFHFATEYFKCRPFIHERIL